MARTEIFSKKTRRQRIIEVTIELMAEEPAKNLKLADISKIVNCDPPLISYYFPSLEHLREEAVEHILNHLKCYVFSQIDSHHENSKNLLKKYISCYFDWVDKHPSYFTVWMHFYTIASKEGKLRTINDEIRNTGRLRIQSILYEGIAKNYFPKLNPKEVKKTALSIQAMITGSVIVYGTENNLKKLSMQKSVWESVLLWLE